MPKPSSKSRLTAAAAQLLDSLSTSIDSLSTTFPFLEESHLPAMRTKILEFRALTSAAALLEDEDDPAPPQPRGKGRTK
jgi:hypothetical protein